MRCLIPLILWMLLVFPGSTVVFHIVDSNENPVKGAEIYFCARKEVTDAEGNATFKDIPDLSNTPYGGCALEIKKEGYLTIADAFAVVQDMELTYVLYSDIMTTISGIVYFDSSDNPAPFVVIRIYDALTDESLPSVLTDGEGRFSFELSVDRRVYVIVSDYETQRFYLEPGKEQVLVINTKGITTDVGITVRDSKGRPLVDVSVTLKSGTIFEGKTDSKGTIIFRNVPYGDYIIIIEKEGYITITEDVSIVSLGRDEQYQLDFILEKATGTVTIQVYQPGEPAISRLVITFEGKEILQISVKETETLTLEPGTYFFAVDAVGFEPVKKQVIVIEGQNTFVDFRLEKSQRTVRVKSESFPWEILLIPGGAVLILIFLWRRHSTA